MGLNLTPRETSEITDTIWNITGFQRELRSGLRVFGKIHQFSENLIINTAITLKSFHADHNWPIVTSFQLGNN